MRNRPNKDGGIIAGLHPQPLDKYRRQGNQDGVPVNPLPSIRDPKYLDDPNAQRVERYANTLFKLRNRDSQLLAGELVKPPEQKESQLSDQVMVEAIVYSRGMLKK